MLKSLRSLTSTNKTFRRLSLRTSSTFSTSLLHQKAVNFITTRKHTFHTTSHQAMDPSWRPPVPAKAGDGLEDIQTPALIVDMDAFQFNLAEMGRSMARFPSVAVRPHAKAHKCPQIAKLQVEHGCVGVCTQTLTETEALVYGGGCMDVLLSNQCIGKPKIQRLAALAKAGAKVSVCVDDSSNIKDMSEVAVDAGVTLDLVVEVNVGQDRCGVEPGEPAVALAKQILHLPAVNFKGVQCYNGWNQHVRQPSDRQAAVDKVVAMTTTTLEAFKAAGVACDYVTGGGTGTYPFEAASGQFTEVQPGSYIFMDADYGRNFGEGGGPFNEYKSSLFVLTTVQSVSAPSRAVVDAGMKAASLDSGAPLVHHHEDVIYHCGGDEHGILRPAAGLKVGDLLHLVPGHCDPTVNLYDWIVVVRSGKVDAVWPVLGRGPGV